MNPFEIEEAITTTALLSQALHRIVDNGGYYLLEADQGRHVARVRVDGFPEADGKGPTPKEALDNAARLLASRYDSQLYREQVEATDRQCLKETRGEMGRSAK